MDFQYTNAEIRLLDMMPLDFEILPYENDFKKLLLDTWERSVLATHDFLSPHDFTEIRKEVAEIRFEEFPIYCACSAGKVLGFVGVVDRNIEMLFVDPEYFGRGLGRKLMEFAQEKLDAQSVDVNEQNVKAVRFYEKMGYETFERTENDGQGRGYPLLRMKLIR